MFDEPGELGSVQEEQQETERVTLHSSPSTSAVMCVCVSVCALLTTILMTVAGTRQSSPGTQQRTVKMNMPTMLVTKAYLGSLVEISVVLASVCCVATMGC